MLAAVGPVGLFWTLSPSDCYPAAPAGPYVAGGPVGPYEKFKVLDPLEHSGSGHFPGCSGAVRAFGSGYSLGWSTYGGVPSSGTDRTFGSGNTF